MLAALDWVDRRVAADMVRLVPKVHAGMRASHGRILDMVGDEGSRPVDLADGAWITKQAMSKRIRELEDLGWISVQPDPSDRRATIVRRTPAGDRVRRAAREAIEAMEQEWESQVGADRYATFRQVLAELVEGYR